MEQLQQYLPIIIEALLIPVLGILVKYLITFLNTKSEELKARVNNETAQKYIDMLNSTIQSCVIATNQTYVAALKAENAFTKEAQKEAFRRSYEAVMAVLNSEAQTYLDSIYGDLNIYIANRIEEEVLKNK